MEGFEHEPIHEVRRRLIAGMVSYMHSSASAAYTQVHVDRCTGIVDACLSALAVQPRLPEAEIRAEVERTIRELNRLNAECDGSLIETDQREGLCELILRAARDAGLPTQEDITLEWRDW